MKNSTLYSLAVATGLALGTAIGLSGCGLLPAKSAALEVFECECAALEPALGAIFDVEDLVRDWYVGRANLINALVSAGQTVEQAQAIVREVQKCDPRNAAPPAPTVLELN